ncbi:hypothetical protein OIU84_030047 [Salix udensis]|uniref:Pentatricopeptide repeat-containing protein n=1 Tax=Salix udensis TaxID=889485 RepID=A0AAD6KB54_9ROSI|nr:hypothetical protein OIU84_030047 [Salix udensis]
MASSTIRHLSTTTTKKISISKAKSRLRTEHDPDKALAIFSSASSNESSPPFVSRYAQDLTVRRLAKSHRFADIESLLESHKSNPQIKQEPFLSSLIRSYGVAGMFDQALKTYQEMDQLVPVLFNEISEKYRVLPDKVSYGMLVKAYCEDGKPEKAIEGKNEEADRFLDWMVERGCELDAVVYNVKISNAVNQGAERVKELIEEMKNSGLKPDTISYNYLMTSYCMSGMMEEAKKVYEGLRVHGCKANPATYRTLVFNLCKNGEYEKGYKIFRDSVREHRIPDFEYIEIFGEGFGGEEEDQGSKRIDSYNEEKVPS